MVSIELEINQKQFKNEWHKAFINLMFTSAWINSKHKELFDKYDITTQQYNVLRILRGVTPKCISTSTIKERMIDRNSDASRIVSRLLKLKLVERTINTSDKRLVDVSITKKGLALLAEIDVIINQNEKSQLNLTAQEALQLNQLLDKLRDPITNP